MRHNPTLETGRRRMKKFEFLPSESALSEVERAELNGLTNQFEREVLVKLAARVQEYVRQIGLRQEIAEAAYTKEANLAVGGLTVAWLAKRANVKAMTIDASVIGRLPSKDGGPIVRPVARPLLAKIRELGLETMLVPKEDELSRGHDQLFDQVHFGLPEDEYLYFLPEADSLSETRRSAEFLLSKDQFAMAPWRERAAPNIIVRGSRHKYVEIVTSMLLNDDRLFHVGVEQVRNLAYLFEDQEKLRRWQFVGDTTYSTLYDELDSGLFRTWDSYKGKDGTTSRMIVDQFHDAEAIKRSRYRKPYTPSKDRK